MKKYISFFIVLSIIAMAYLQYKSNSEIYEVSAPAEDFVSIKNNKFSLKGKDFYPVILNYMVATQADKNGIWACSYPGYNPNSKHLYTTKDSCLIQLKADMELIKEMGFNAVRLVGIGEERIEDKKTGVISIGANIANLRDTSIQLTNKANYNKYFNALHELFDIANNAGLKVIFLTRNFRELPTTAEHLKKMAIHFRNDTALMAYDLFNEPLYFDSLERNKEDVYNITREWRKAIKKYAPKQLCTIGLAGIREIFEWDPNIIDVDFLSIHPYEYEPEQVRNEIYWYGKYIKKPWIIGETAIPADNDSITYQTQKEFAVKTVNQTYNCGGIGYSWWQYKDVEWFNYHANFMGMVNKQGETKTVKGGLVKGTVKPVAEAFKSFVPWAKKDSCLCLSNYYNYSQKKDFKITGRLVNQEGQPIDGGVVMAWNQYWSHCYHTVTKPDGTFELLGAYPFYHWIASASLYSMVRADVLPDTAKTGTDNIPTINIGELKLEKLSFVD